jgi:formate dehydrogenase (NADP+) alpha subunit
MSPDVRLQIDRHVVEVPAGTTVLRAAEAAGVAVPALCSHPELTPFGGCRLCAVEIEGMKPYPLACSTAVAADMRVLTDTAGLREERRQILGLLLSQHPSSCLVCGEQDDCQRTQQTIRKAGVATGCRSCPRDGACELQQVAELVGVDGGGHPVAYRGLEPEHDEPFYDRDYNLCILCGRCVRMCAEVRGSGVLAFVERGPRTLIGPAFGRSHEAAGCEFCGACVSVCPTGALADKVSKWDGAPDGVTLSTCPLCPLGCQVELAHAGGRLSSVCGAHDPEINDGQLCLRGRFCLPETTQHPSRARRPRLRKGRYDRVVGWDEALAEVSARLAGARPADTLVLLGGDLTNEAIHMAQRLAREGLSAPGVDSTVRDDLPGGPEAWSRLFALPVSIEGVATSDVALVAGLDPRYSFSVAGVQVRRALRRGARLVTVDARATSLSRVADQDLRPQPGDEAMTLTRLLRTARGQRTRGPAHTGDDALVAAASELRRARAPAIVLGPRVFDCAGADELLAELELLAKRSGVSIVPLTHAANARGALELGALTGLLPGPRWEPTGRRRRFDLAALQAGGRPAVLYLIGEAPFAERPPCDYVIAQDLYPPPFPVDAFLPAASFAEAGGTLTNVEGRVQELRPVEQPEAGAGHDGPRPDWAILSAIARHLGRDDLSYADAADVRRAIRAELSQFPRESDRMRRRMTPLPRRRRRADVAVPGRGRFTLVPERAAFRHRGTDLSAVVEGLGELDLESGVRMHPGDLDRLGVRQGGTVGIDLGGDFVVASARPDPACPRGAVYAVRVAAWGGLAAGDRLGALARLPARPLRVRVTAADGSACARREDHGRHR